MMGFGGTNKQDNGRARQDPDGQEPINKKVKYSLF